ncbi:MAG: MFS transporter, partial [Planctomycetota bacterium]
DEEIHCEYLGLVWGIGPLCEVPIILYSRKILNRIGVNALFTLGLIGVAVRLFGISLATSMWHIIPLQLLHALTFGAYHVGSVTFLSRIVPSHMNSSAQTVLAAFSAGLAGIAGGALGGYLADHFGYSELYTVFAGIAVVSLIPFALCCRRTRQEAPPTSAG